jgi:hypothetical protein
LFNKSNILKGHPFYDTGICPPVIKGVAPGVLLEDSAGTLVSDAPMQSDAPPPLFVKTFAERWHAAR